MFRSPISFGQTVWRELAVIVARAVPYGVILCHSPLAWRKRNDVETNDPLGLRPMSCPREFKTEQRRTRTIRSRLAVYPLDMIEAIRG
jgi:hypothetical protein